MSRSIVRRPCGVFRPLSRVSLPTTTRACWTLSLPAARSMSDHLSPHSSPRGNPVNAARWKIGNALGAVHGRQEVGQTPEPSPDRACRGRRQRRFTFESSARETGLRGETIVYGVAERPCAAWRQCAPEHCSGSQVRDPVCASTFFGFGFGFGFRIGGDRLAFALDGRGFGFWTLSPSFGGCA